MADATGTSPEEPVLNAHSEERLSEFARIRNLIVFLIGARLPIGWLLSIDFLTRLIPEQFQMKANPAVGLALAGAYYGSPGIDE